MTPSRGPFSSEDICKKQCKIRLTFIYVFIVCNIVLRVLRATIIVCCVHITEMQSSNYTVGYSKVRPVNRNVKKYRKHVLSTSLSSNENKSSC